MWPVITRGYIADKIVHGFFVGLGIAGAMTVVQWSKYTVACIGSKIDWGHLLEEAKRRPDLLFENPKRKR